LTTLEAGLEQFRATGARTVLGLLVPMQAEAMLAAGRPVELVSEVLEAGAAEVLASGERACLPYLDLARARVASAQGADGSSHLQRAEDQASEMGLLAAVERARRCRV
jgi:hypothetical protein